MRILLVDDHPLFVDALRDLLTRRGVAVVGVARDGLEALHQVRVLRPDVILMDIQMPHCDGLTATRLIAAELPAIKIVMLTMLEDDENLFKAIKSGACGYLLKTMDTNAFMQALEALARGEPPLAPGLAVKIWQSLARPSRTTSVDADDTPAELTARQMQILDLAAQGLTYKEIGAHLALTERTIKYHMGEIVQRLHLENRAQAVAYARRYLGKGD